ncbi:MAG: RNA polymerase factor sigma-70 [Eubacteriales bacterium]|nr:RNA polymerase factor sigma-70 [Eubacteriales bacterium]
MKNLTHEDLARLAQEGDNSALEYLINTYKNIVRLRARKFFLIGGDYEDLIQEGTIGLFKAIRDYNPAKNTSFTTFAELCIRRQLYTAIKSANRKKHLLLNDSLSLDFPVEENDNKNLSDIYADQSIMSPDEIMESEEKLNEINKIIDTMLSPLEKTVIEMYLDGKNYREIAKIIKKEEKSVDNALNRAKNKLRNALKQ